MTMRRLAVLPFVVAALVVAAAAAPACAQATFKIPYKFESAGKKLAAGEYVVTKTGDAQLTFKQASTGKETALPFTGTLKPAEPPVAEPRIVFDEVGNFEPSYTEYFTVYVVAEVWLSGQDGYLVHTTKGAHKTQVVKGEVAHK
jgi:hypothetical protein